MTDSWTELDRLPIVTSLACLARPDRRLRWCNQVTPSLHRMLKVRAGNRLMIRLRCISQPSRLAPEILLPHLAGANPRPNTDHKMQTSRWSIDDFGVEDAMDDMPDSTYIVEPIVNKKSSAFDVDLRATREAQRYERGAHVLGDEDRESNLTTKGKGTSAYQ